MPISIIGWNQPANDAVRGNNWSIWLDGVDSATSPGTPNAVSLPASMALFGIGMLGLAMRRNEK